MGSAGVERRVFLAGGAAAIAGASLAPLVAGCAPPGSPLRDSERARRIGERFADRYPEGEAALWRGRPPESEAAWVSRIRELRRSDFEEDRLVQVDGWWLAETELRLCVLLHGAG